MLPTYLLKCQGLSNNNKIGSWISYHLNVAEVNAYHLFSIAAVTTARVSGDYILSKDQWRVGLSSFLSTSLGLAPFKDVFWTCPENPGSPFYSDCMIVSNNTDPNIPWTLNYRYNGYKNVTGTTAFQIQKTRLIYCFK